MMLKYLLISELNFSESWKFRWKKISNSSKTDKYMTLFWFLGIFIYLIDRDPADLWLTLICLFFLARCIKRKDWRWTSQFWFKSKARIKLFECLRAATAFVVPLGLFFQIQKFGSFYGQWSNLFIWFAIAFALSQVQSYKEDCN